MRFDNTDLFVLQTGSTQIDMGNFSFTNTSGFEGNLDMKSNRITSLGAAVDDTDAISRGYAD